MASKDQFVVDDFNFDNELAFPDFGGEGNGFTVKDDRSPVTKFASGFGEGMKDALTSEAFIRTAVKTALPRGYGQALDMTGEVTSSVKDLYNSTAQELKPVIKDLRRITGRVLPDAEKFLPKSVADKLREFSKDPDERSGSDFDPREASIQGSLGEVFQMQAETEAKKEKTDDTKDKLREGVQQLRFRSEMHELDAIRIGVQQLASYQDKVGVNFQRKSLELQYRQYFVAMDALQEAKTQGELFKEALPVIAKNTGLPDYVKKTPMESMKEIMRNKFIESMNDGIFDKRRNFVRNFTRNLTKTIKNKVAQSASDFQMALAGGEMMLDAAEMQKEMGGEFDGYGMAGNMAANTVVDSFGAKYGKKLREYIEESNAGKPIVGLGNKLIYGATNLAQEAGMWAKSDKNSNIPFVDLIKETINSTLGRQDNSLDVDDLGNLQEPMPFNRRTAKSINEIIPGLLARIHREIKILRTGDENAELVSYDFSSNKFSTEEKVQKKIFTEVIKQENKASIERDVREIVDLVDKDKKLSPEERKILGEFMLKDNVEGHGVSHSRRLTDVTSYEGKFSKDAEMLAEAFKRYFEKDEVGNKQIALSSKYAQLGDRISDSRKKIQEFSLAGQQELLGRLGLITEDFDAVAQKNINNMHYENLGKTSEEEYQELQAKNVESVSSEGDAISKKAGKPYSRKARGRTPIEEEKQKPEFNAGIKQEPIKLNVKDLKLDLGEVVGALGENRSVEEKQLAMLEKIEERLNAGIKFINMNGISEAMGDGMTSLKEGLKKGKRWWNESVLENMKSLGSGAWNLGGKAVGAVSEGFNRTKKWGGKGIEKVKEWWADDLWLPGETVPRLLAWKMEAGHYIDEASGKVIKSAKDITSNVIDTTLPAGQQIVLQATDRFKIEARTIGGKIKNIAKALGGGFLKKGKELYDKLPAAYATALGIGKKIVQKVWGVLDGPVDVYVKGRLEQPALTALGMRSGYYRSKMTGKAIEKVSDIDGPVIAADSGDVLLTHDDIAKGLVDKNGKPIRHGLGKLFGMGKDLVKGAVRSVMKAGSAVAGWLRNSLGSVREFFAGMLGPDGLLFGGAGQMVDHLAAIRQILDDRLPGGSKKVEGDADGDGVRDGSAADQRRKRKPKGKTESVARPDEKPGVFGKMQGFFDRIAKRFEDKDEDSDEGGIDVDIDTDGGSDRRKSRKQRLKDKARHAKDRTVEKLKELREKTKPHLDEAKEKAKDKIQEAREKGKIKAEEAREKAKTKYAEGKAKAKGYWETTREKLKEKADARKALKAEKAAAKAAAKKPSFGGRMARAGMRGLGKGAWGLAKGVGSVGMGAARVVGATGSLLNAGISGGASLLGRGLMMGASALAPVAGAAVSAVGSAVGAGLGLAGSALAGVGAILASPVVLGALAVGAVAAGGYFAYKYFTRNKLDDWSKLRYIQYGFAADKNDWVSKVFELEDLLLPYITYDQQGNAAFHVSSLDDKVKEKLKDNIKAFGVSFDKQDQVENWLHWFDARFRPVYLTHLTALKKTKDKVPLSDVGDKLSAVERKKYFDLAKFPDGPYGAAYSPTPELKSLPSGAKEVKAYVDQMQPKIDKEAADEEKKGKDGGKSKNAATRAAIAASDSVSDPVAQKAQASKPGEKDAKPGTPGAKPATPKAGAPAAAAVAAAVAGGGKDTGAIKVEATAKPIGGVIGGIVSGVDAVRYKAYGIKEMEADKLSVITTLEAEVVSFIKIDGKKVVSWNGSPEAMFNKHGAAFGVDLSDSNHKASWMSWFTERFLPTYLNYLTLLFSATNKSDVNAARVALKDQAAVDVAMGVLNTSVAGKSVWLNGRSPWPGYELNGNVNSTDKNIAGLKDQAKQAVLNEQQSVDRKGTKDGSDKKSANGANQDGNKNQDADKTKDQGFFKDMVSGAKDALSSVKSGYGKAMDALGFSNHSEEYGQGTVVNMPTKGTGGKYDEVPVPTGDGNAPALAPTINAAAKIVGVDPSLMMRIAAIESGFRAGVVAKGTNATGLFQFLPSTWKEYTSRFSKKFGIMPGTPATDPRANALLGAAFLRENADYISKTKDKITDTDLYMAHFLGKGGAAKFFKANPSISGPAFMPKEARANPDIFYNKGTPRTLSEIYQLLNGRMHDVVKRFGLSGGGGSEAMLTSAPTPQAAAAPTAPAAAAAQPAKPAAAAAAAAATTAKPAAAAAAAAATTAMPKSTATADTPMMPNEGKTAKPQGKKAQARIPISDQAPGLTGVAEASLSIGGVGSGYASSANEAKKRTKPVAPVETPKAEIPTSPAEDPAVKVIGEGFNPKPITPKVPDIQVQQKVQQEALQKTFGSVDEVLKKSHVELVKQSSTLDNILKALINMKALAQPAVSKEAEVKDSSPTAAAKQKQPQTIRSTSTGGKLPTPPVSMARPV